MADREAPIEDVLEQGFEPDPASGAATVADPGDASLPEEAPEGDAAEQAAEVGLPEDESLTAPDDERVVGLDEDDYR